MLVIELDSNLLAEPLPASMDRGECVLREWLVAGHQVRQHGSTSLTCNGSCKLALGMDAVKGAGADATKGSDPLVVWPPVPLSESMRILRSCD